MPDDRMPAWPTLGYLLRISGNYLLVAAATGVLAFIAFGAASAVIAYPRISIICASAFALGVICGWNFPRIRHTTGRLYHEALGFFRHFPSHRAAP
jgi:hypothetical protein